MAVAKPHDLIWIKEASELISSLPLPAWVYTEWNCQLPLVIRRDSSPQGNLVPVGIRGERRSHRAAAWVQQSVIQKIITPEMIVSNIINSPVQLDIAEQPLLALLILIQYEWPWSWGITGSCGYSLASKQFCIHRESDLDLIIYCPVKPEPHLFDPLIKLLAKLPCHVDIQLETPNGACALLEWCRGEKVLLKTNFGPKLVSDPWETTP